MYHDKFKNMMWQNNNKWIIHTSLYDKQVQVHLIPRNLGITRVWPENQLLDTFTGISGMHDFTKSKTKETMQSWN